MAEGVMNKSVIGKSLPIIIINRAKDTARRQVMSQRLDLLGLKYQFFEAVDGHSFDAHNVPEYDGNRRRQYFGRDLTAGEIGCLLSHRAIYKMMVGENMERALILEDDTIFQPEFPEVLSALLEGDLQWDILRFLNAAKILKSPHRLLKSLSTGHNLYTIQATPGGAYAYILTKHAAKRLLDHTEKNWLPIDMMHGWCWKTKLQVVAMLPSPVVADYDVKSTIGDQRFDKTLHISGIVRALFPLYRMWFKFSSGIGKRYAFRILAKK
ncbi:MAG: glycosyltransferase family 25 protein [Sneathiella sp.]